MVGRSSILVIFLVNIFLLILAETKENCHSISSSLFADRTLPTSFFFVAHLFFFVREQMVAILNAVVEACSPIKFYPPNKIICYGPGEDCGPSTYDYYS